MKQLSYLQCYLRLNKKNESYLNFPSLDLLKKDYIRYILKLTNNNLKETAAILDVSLYSLQHQLNK